MASRASDTASIVSSARNPAKKLWRETQWTTLSWQAQSLGLSKEPYFDPATMLLSKEVNARLWRQLGQLYDLLGPDQAPFATPVMLKGGEVEWHSYLDNSKGEKGKNSGFLVFNVIVVGYTNISKFIAEVFDEE